MKILQNLILIISSRDVGRAYKQIIIYRFYIHKYEHISQAYMNLKRSEIWTGKRQATWNNLPQLLSRIHALFRLHITFFGGEKNWVIIYYGCIEIRERKKVERMSNFVELVNSTYKLQNIRYFMFWRQLKLLFKFNKTY